MRVAVYYSNNDIRIEERPKPAIGEGELLVRIEASGICGTDCLEWYRINRVPLILGHEIAGTIVEAGKGVKGFKVGDRISASHHVPCGECRFCLAGHETVCDTLRKTNFDPGGFAEFMRIPKINVEKDGVYPLQKDISFEEATFIEPLACVMRGQRFANFSAEGGSAMHSIKSGLGGKKGKTVLIVGSGISGLLHIQLAKLNGAKKIIAIDVAEYRLNAAQKFGADHVLYAKDYNANRLREINDSFLADLVIICTGAKPAYEEALKSIERGGTILFFAATDKGMTIPISINDLFWRNEVTLMSSYAGSPKDHVEALNLISSKKINVYDMITHRLSLVETGIGFKLVSEARDSIKVIIEPQR